MVCGQLSEEFASPGVGAVSPGKMPCIVVAHHYYIFPLRSTVVDLQEELIVVVKFDAVVVFWEVN